MTYTTTELAERWRCSLDSIYRMIKSGKLKAFRVGQEYRIAITEIARIEEGG